MPAAYRRGGKLGVTSPTYTRINRQPKDTHPRVTRAHIYTRGGTWLHSQLPNECDYLPRVLEFMAIIFVIIEISSALWTQKI